MKDVNCGEELATEFFHGKVSEVAEDLIGKLLVNEANDAAGIIVETEAYLGVKDPASHLVKAGEKRQETFSKGARTVYVFKIYQHNNLNFLTEHDGVTEGVLVRAVEPISGIKGMKTRRGVEEAEELCSGPGKLCEAFDIKKDNHNGEDLSESPISVYDTDTNFEVEETPRIGISEAQHWPLRFAAKNNYHVSKKVSREKKPIDTDKFYSE